MSVAYKAVLWNRQKFIYDAILLSLVVLYIVLFINVTQWFDSNIDIRGVRIRAFGSAAFILLHVILSIGPLTRLSPKFYPLLYNRRHMGVTMFFLALQHTRLGLQWYHDFGNLEPLVSLFVSNTNYFTFIRFPFQVLGFVPLVILFLMAATSHDFWLANLTAPVWKGLHMSVYLAYGLLTGHVLLGALQTNKHPVLTLAVGVGLVWIVGVHLAAGIREFGRDNQDLVTGNEEFVDAGSIAEIPEKRAKIVTLGGERVAIFKYDGKISAVSNVCQHQNGPLGEGKIVDGCITCPWHGYQYLPENGASPPPFTEKIPTFDIKLEGDRILVKTIPNLPGTSVSPAVIAMEEQT
ncbi:MAG: Rieske 2Fe-2S domain-containing protein [Moorea sp. SIOASIH]|uniref:Rieske 2Fe-2S domain-containing protein n=1 Tax=Moorena sp. SIOASIH TaxID=2607817 RepID=UPI0013B690B6|nr:Rieske 2Fe-2S domain-containing protein [Moorena sp. SIOASIH]NEO38292.1 Rieske 2Fe-2S domain-containing protein [Moorena sp. SIOASIH]